jgi:hypothetical protein
MIVLADPVLMAGSVGRGRRRHVYAPDVSQLEIPRFGALLAPFISQVPADAMPRFLALLERAAANRYREWADALPEFADQLLACAASEDAISDRIEAAFPLDPALRNQVHAPLQGAVDTYRAAFATFDVWDQLRVQADAERQGAQAWRNIALRVDSPDQLAALTDCSTLEEASADALDALIALHAPSV